MIEHVGENSLQPDIGEFSSTDDMQNSFDFAFVTWWPLIFYPVTDAPNYRKGYIASLVTGILTIPIIILIAWLEQRGRRKGAIGRLEDDDLDDRSSIASGSDVPPVPASTQSESKNGAKSDATSVHNDAREEDGRLLLV